MNKYTAASDFPETSNYERRQFVENLGRSIQLLLNADSFLLKSECDAKTVQMTNEKENSDDEIKNDQAA